MNCFERMPMWVLNVTMMGGAMLALGDVGFVERFGVGILIAGVMFFFCYLTDYIIEAIREADATLERIERELELSSR